MRAAGMRVLTDQIKEKRPGVIIYGIGDEEHQEHISGHNEDDTPGVRAEDQDADSIREHRAIDVMVGNTFTSDDGDRLVQDLVTNPTNRERMIYVNWGTRQWHRRNNWQPVDNSDDPHGHVHISGEADADDNIAPWNLSNWDRTQEGEMTPLESAQVNNSEHYLQAVVGMTAQASNISNTVQHDLTVPNKLAEVLLDIQAKVSAGSAGISEARLRAIIREEIAKTRLA